MSDQKKSKSSLTGILQFLHEAEDLKMVLRHSWLSNGRRESVAEHTWRMSLMAIILHREIGITIDIGRVLQMIVVHDLAEVHVGDYQVFGKEQPENKHELEEKALQKMVKQLPSLSGKEILSLWQEYERRETDEAKFAGALDKLEVLLQHNEADPSTYLPGEGEFNLTYADDKMFDNPVMIEFRELIRTETKRILNNS